MLTEGYTSASLWCCSQTAWSLVQTGVLNSCLAYSVQLKALGCVWLATWTRTRDRLLAEPCLFPYLSLWACLCVADDTLKCFTLFFFVSILFFCFRFSGGRNIVVTGSGFDLIQTAVMKVQGKNLTAMEVRAQYLPFHFLFLFIFFAIFLLTRHVWKSPSLLRPS